MQASNPDLLSMQIPVTKLLNTQIKHLEADTSMASETFHRCGFNSAYSAAPGLHQLAANHANVLANGLGSAQQVLDSYREQVRWLHQQLEANADAISHHDACVSQALATNRCTIPEPDAVAFPARPDTHYDNFTFIPPVVAGAAPLATTLAAFESTNTGMADQAAEQWLGAATQLDTVATELDDISTSLVEVNSGKIFDRASARIADTARTGRNFAANARTMAASVGVLNNIRAWAIAQLRTAQAELNLITDPVARTAAETEYMLGFLGVALPQAVQQAVPPITNLMDTPPEPPPHETHAQVGMTHTATAGLDITAGQLANVAQQAGRLAQVTGQVSALAGNAVGAFIPPNPHGFQAMMQAGQQLHAGTGVAAAGMVGGPLALGPGMAGVGAQSGAAHGGAGLGVLPVGAGGLRGNAPQSGAFQSGALRGGAGAMLPRGVAATPAGVSTPTASPHSGAHSGPHAAMVPLGRTPGRHQRSITRPRIRAGLGSDVGGGLQSSGSIGTGSNGGGLAQQGFTQQGPAQPGLTPSRLAAPTGAASTGSLRYGPAMMGGMPMAGAGSKNSAQQQAKAVTSSVEAEGNVADLLGQPPRVVPGVIGDWVRD